ncbi:hypothetical protein MIND_00375600 [Mycena indigotica]|uniref:Uncharacterized protein n=1 Tax=Mycena indigotica TaxID=2126181 RepID=A0A8H6T459_9AGAR|nr:uncharacterized protein MIND_00375600 [Mycena indigotica]KAF7310027.1 hypothetical protein MIND_00375600 [Mycena indigotica]
MAIGSRPTLVPLHLSLLLLILSLRTTAKLVTRTIDDTAGDSATGAVPSYAPADQFSLNSNCGGCVYHPDPGRTFGGTWHDTSQVDAQARSVSFSFTGTSVSIFCTLVNRQSPATFLGATHLALAVDGAARGTFDHTPDGSADFAYQQPVFRVAGLPSARHSVVLTTNSAQGSYLVFDYASYTFDDGAADPPPANPPPANPPPAQTVATTDTKTVVSTAPATGPTTTATTTTTLGGVGGSPVSASAPGPGSGGPSPDWHASAGASTPAQLLGPGTSSAGASPASSAGSAAAVTGAAAQKHTGVAAVVAGVLAGVVGLLLALLVVVLCRRKRRRRDEATEMTQARPLPVAVPVAVAQVGDGGQEYRTPLSGAGTIGDPEKAVLGQNLYEPHHHASIATFTSGSGSDLSQPGHGAQTGRLSGLLDDDLEYYAAASAVTSVSGTARATAPSVLSRAPTFRSEDMYSHGRAQWQRDGPDPPPGYERTDSGVYAHAGFFPASLSVSSGSA